MDLTKPIPTTFKAFWPYYVGEHRNPLNRRLHFIGTSLGLVCLALAVIELEAWWLIGMPLFGYGFAWFGHFRVEHNRPATFQRPFLSLFGDYKMFALILQNKMNREVQYWAERGFRFDK